MTLGAADTLPIIYKVRDGSITDGNNGSNGSNGSLIGDEFTDFQVDVIAEVIVELRSEFKSTMNVAIADATAPLRKNIARFGRSNERSDSNDWGRQQSSQDGRSV
jgi:hypothetical protein